MNPIEEFYEKQEKHNILNDYIGNKYLVNYEIVKDKDGYDFIKITPETDLRKIINKKSVNLIIYRIYNYFNCVTRETEAVILKKSKEGLERKRERVIRDFRINDLTKEVK